MGRGRAQNTDTPIAETTSGAAPSGAGDGGRTGTAAGGTSPDTAARREGLAEECVEVLRGFRYPAERRDLVRYARFGRAPTRVVKAPEALPERTYRGVPDLRREFDRSRPPS